jgi:hypothetical protein
MRARSMPIRLVVRRLVLNHPGGGSDLRLQTRAYAGGKTHCRGCGELVLIRIRLCRGPVQVEVEDMALAIAKVRLPLLQPFSKPVRIALVASGGRCQLYIGSSAADTVIGDAWEVGFAGKPQFESAV